MAARNPLNLNTLEGTILDLSPEKLDCIRIIVSGGRGMGHQRANITLMRKLREMGFKGRFDIRYKEFYPQYWHTPTQLKDVGYIGKILSQLISGFEPKNISVPDSGWECPHPELGLIRVTRLPELPYDKNHDLPPVKLTVTGAGGESFPYEVREHYRTDYYIQLQPTGWEQEDRYIVFINNELIYLPQNNRLSSRNQFTAISEEIKLTPTEQNIIKLCEDKNIDTQLIYGLYPTLIEYPTGITKETGSLDPAIECENLIEAHRIRQKENAKPILLLFPQEIWSDFEFRAKINKLFDNIVWIDITNPKDIESFDSSNVPKNTIFMAYTGRLHPRLFDSLMLERTTLPPVVEGCNSREACEFAGRSFLQGGSKHQPLDLYAIGDEKYSACQSIHSKASACLRTGSKEDIPALVTYMKSAFTEDFLNYHARRQIAFLARPDACETAFHVLIIKACKLNKSLDQKRNYATGFTVFKPIESETKHPFNEYKLNRIYKEADETYVKKLYPNILTKISLFGTDKEKYEILFFNPVTRKINSFTRKKDQVLDVYKEVEGLNKKYKLT